MSAKEQPGDAATVFTSIDVRKQIAMAVVAPSKSLKQKSGLTELERFIYDERRTQAILQCDDENSIKARRRAAIKHIEGFTGRLAPTGSSQSQ